MLFALVFCSYIVPNKNLQVSHTILTVLFDIELWGLMWYNKQVEYADCILLIFIKYKEN